MCRKGADVLDKTLGGPTVRNLYHWELLLLNVLWDYHLVRRHLWRCMTDVSRIPASLGR